MTGSASLAKVTRPRIRNPVARPRLFDMLDSCCKHPVIWLSAPAGSGKTTLTASYLSEKKLRAIWYLLDEGDGDPSTFFYYMGLAAKKAAPRKKAPLPLLTPVYELGIPTFTLRYFESLYSRLKTPFVIVLDNYHLVSEASSLHDHLCQGLEIVPEDMNVIILSRQEPPAHFARLRANEQLYVTESSQINFTLEESKEFIVQRTGRHLPDQAVSKFHELTQGWAAGLALFMESLRIKGIDEKTLKPISNEEIFQYFTREIFDQFDDESQDILLKTAFLPRMTAAMAKNLTGSERAKVVLVGLNHNHFFTQRDNQADPFYQYHPLFREFLMNQARARLPKEQLQKLYLLSASVLEDAGLIDDAAESILNAADYDRLQHFLLAHAPSLLNQGRRQIVHDWLNRVPSEIVDTSPWLLTLKARTSILESPVAAQGYFEKANSMFRQSDDRLGQAMSYSDILTCIVNNLADFSRLGTWIEKLEILLEDDIAFPSPDLELAFTINIIAPISWCYPYHTTQVRSWIDRSLKLAREAGRPDQEFVALTLAVSYYRRMQDRQNSAYFLARANELAGTRRLSPFFLYMWRLAVLSTKTIGLGKGPEDVLSYALEALEFGRRHGIHIFDQGFLFLGGLYSLGAGDTNKTSDLLRRLEQITKPDSVRQVAMYQIVAAWHYLHHGDIPSAVRVVNQMPESHEALDSYIHRIFHLTQTQVLWAHGDQEAAFLGLRRVKELATQFNDNSHAAFEYRLIEAQFLLDKGMLDQGLASLAKSLAIAREQGYNLNDVLLPPTVPSRLCLTALIHGIEVGFVQQLIRRFEIRPQTPTLEIPDWPWQIRIFTLGKFDILIEDKPVEPAHLKKKPLLLLKALIASGGRGVQIDHLSELLWPEADGDMAYASFKMTLSRLRRLLGAEGAIETHEGAVSLDTQKVWLDIWAFQRMYDLADAKKEDPAVLFKQTIALYQGDFLPFESELWMISPREKYRDRFLRLIAGLGRELEKKELWREAISCYQAGLDIDDLAEQFYHRLMICHARLDDKATVASTYTRLQKILKSRLDIEPSNRIKALYRQIMK